MSLINTYRKNSYQEPLRQSKDLKDSAQRRARCIDSGECSWSHEGFKDSLNADRCQEFGETLARNFTSDDDVFSAWNDSESHAAVMYGNYTHYGIATHGSVTVMHTAKCYTRVGWYSPILITLCFAVVVIMMVFLREIIK